MRFAWLSGGLLLLGCGSVLAPIQYDNLPDGGADAAVGEEELPDAMPDAAPTFVTDAIEGRWTFTLGNPAASHLECAVTIEDGGYFVACPDPPSDIGPGCTQERYLRMTGTLGDALEGNWDTVTKNDGPGCTAAQMPGVEQVESAWAIMAASRLGSSTETGFLQAMYGPWHWDVVVSADPTEGFACDVSFSPAIVDSRANWSAECCETRADVAPMCAHLSCTTLHGTIATAQLDGEAKEEERYTGSGCVAGGYPDPVVQTGSVTAMSATR